MPASSRQGRTINRINPLPRGLCCVPCRERRVRCDGGRSPGCSACVRKARWDGRNIDTDLGCYYKEPASNSSNSPPSASCSTAASTSHSHHHSHDPEQKPFSSSTTTTPSKKPLSRRAARKPKGSTPPSTEQPAAPLQKGLACIACKARRVKCSGSKPACDSCVRNARWNGRCPDTEHGCVFRADLPRQTAPYHPVASQRDLADQVQEPFLSACLDSRMKRSSSCVSDVEGEEEGEEGYSLEEASFGDDSDVGTGRSLGSNLGVGNAPGLVERIDEDVKRMIIPDEEEFDPAVSPSAGAPEDPTFSLSGSDVLLSEPEFTLLPHRTEPILSTSPRLVPSLYASSSTTDTSSSCPSPLLASPSLSPLGTPHAFFGHDLALVSYPPMPYPPASYWTQVRLPPPPMFELDWDALRLDHTDEAGGATTTDREARPSTEEDRMMLGSLFKGTGMFGKEMMNGIGVGGAGLERTTTTVGGEGDGEVGSITVDPRMTMTMGHDSKTTTRVEEEIWKKKLGDLMNEDVTREWGL